MHGSTPTTTKQIQKYMVSRAITKIKISHWGSLGYTFQLWLLIIFPIKVSIIGRYTPVFRHTQIFKYWPATSVTATCSLVAKRLDANCATRGFAKTRATAHITSPNSAGAWSGVLRHETPWPKWSATSCWGRSQRSEMWSRTMIGWIYMAYKGISRISQIWPSFIGVYVYWGPKIKHLKIVENVGHTFATYLLDSFGGPPWLYPENCWQVVWTSWGLQTPEPRCTNLTNLTIVLHKILTPDNLTRQWKVHDTISKL